MLLKGDEIFYIRELRYLKIAWKMTYYIWLGRKIQKEWWEKHKTYMEYEPFFFCSFACNK